MKYSVLFFAMAILPISSWAISSHALETPPATESARTWLCSGGVSRNGKTKIEVLVNAQSEAIATSTYDGGRQGMKLTEITRLPYIGHGEYGFSQGYCTDQEHGGQDFLFNFNGSTTARYFTYWCDDDGWSGSEDYNLSCLEVR